MEKMKQVEPDEHAVDPGQLNLDGSQEHNETVVTYSIKYVYTAEFARVTADIPGYLAVVTDEINQGRKFMSYSRCQALCQNSYLAPDWLHH